MLYFHIVNIGFLLSACWGRGRECHVTFCAIVLYGDLQLILLSSTQLVTSASQRIVDSELSTTLRSFGEPDCYFLRGSLMAYHGLLQSPPILSVNLLLLQFSFRIFATTYQWNFYLLVPSVRLYWLIPFFFLISGGSQGEGGNLIGLVFHFKFKTPL